MTCGTRDQISPTVAAFDRMRALPAQEKPARALECVAVAEIEALCVEVSGQLLEVETPWREALAVIDARGLFAWGPSRGRAEPS